MTTQIGDVHVAGAPQHCSRFAALEIGDLKNICIVVFENKQLEFIFNIVLKSIQYRNKQLAKRNSGQSRNVKINITRSSDATHIFLMNLCNIVLINRFH